ncbi:hypothetical protein RUND412_004189, partial [Rhizina undulata]
LFVGTCLSFTSNAMSEVLGLNEEAEDETLSELSSTSSSDIRQQQQPHQQSEFQSRHIGARTRLPFSMASSSSSRIFTILEEEEEDYSPFLHPQRRKNKRRDGIGRRHLKEIWPVDISSESWTEASDSDF